MNEEMRKAFEEYCKINLFVSLDVDGDGNFSNRETKDKFMLWRLAWKASRKAMRLIKLPAKSYIPVGHYKSDYDRGIDDAISMCEEAIKQAGYKVEE